MKLQITLDMDGPAFEDAPDKEAACVLLGVVLDLLKGRLVGTDSVVLRDSEGVKCGHWQFTLRKQ